MKTQNKFWVVALVCALFFNSTGFAQEKPSYKMVELTYIMPKIGMEQSLVKAITAHDNMYHKSGPYAAHLDYISTGKEAGWYVWGMGSTTFTDLDNRPDKGAHADDWNKNVSPNVYKYGRVEYWKMNDKFTYGITDGMAMPKYETIWIIDVTRGQYYRFKDFMIKIKEAYAKKGGDGKIAVYENQFTENDGRDVAVVWPFNSWAEMDKDDGGIKKQFEEINGEGSWDNAMKDWAEFTQGVVQQVWKIGVN